MPFIAGASAAVGTIDVAIEMLITTGANAFDLILLTDSGGHPGATIESIHRAVTPGTPGVVSVDSLSHPILTARQSYWLAASVDGMSEMSWFTNLVGDVGPVGVRDAPADWVLVDDSRGAFRVLSRASIPERSTLPLALLAAVTLAALTRRPGPLDWTAARESEGCPAARSDHMSFSVGAKRVPTHQRSWPSAP